jgi:hypothetical protein
MILDIYKDSLEYSLQDGKTLLKLGLMMLFSFLVVPIFLVLGYSYRVLDTATHGMINGDEKLPPFDDLISMFVDGLKVFLVKFVYLIIPILIFALFSLVSGGLSGLNKGVGNGIMTIGIIISIILAIILYFLSIMAVANMVAENGSIKDAFNFKGIFQIITNIGWLRYVGFYLGLIIIMIVISAVIGFIITMAWILLGVIGQFISTFGAGIGFIIGLIIALLVYLFFVTPYLTIFENRAVGLIYEPLN